MQKGLLCRWVWLALDTEFRRLLIETTVNQDPLVTKGSALVPLVGVDVWEHACYLQYKNVKADSSEEHMEGCELELCK